MKNRSYNNFRRRIHRAAKKDGFPLRVMFELTYRCNFKCRHCYVPPTYRTKYKNKELKTKEVFSILGQLKEMGCFYLGFTGGEPFLRKDIMQILRYAKRKGFEIIIYTNGSLIDKQIASELKNINPNKVDITIPAISKEAFERVAGVVGAKEEVFRAIKHLNKEGINLGFKTCILKENESEIEKISEFTQSLGCAHRLGDILSSRLDGSKEPYKYRGSAMVAMLNKLKSKKKVFDKCGFKKIVHRGKDRELFQCGAGLMQAAITPAGELKTCVMIDYPKYGILDTSLKECWERLKALSRSITPDRNYKCNRCDLMSYCNWCPARAWLWDRTFTTCDPESKPWAETRRLDYVFYKG